MNMISWDDPLGLSRRLIVERYAEYADTIEKQQGSRVRRALVKAVLNLFTGEPNGKVFRAALDTHINQASVSSGDALRKSLACLSDSTLDST